MCAGHIRKFEPLVEVYEKLGLQAMAVQLILGWRRVLSPRSVNTKRRPHLDRFKQDVQSFTTTQTCAVPPHLSIYRGCLGIIFPLQSYVLSKSLTRPTLIGAVVCNFLWPHGYVNALQHSPVIHLTDFFGSVSHAARGKQLRYPI